MERFVSCRTWSADLVRKEACYPWSNSNRARNGIRSPVRDCNEIIPVAKNIWMSWMVRFSFYSVCGATSRCRWMRIRHIFHGIRVKITVMLRITHSHCAATIRLEFSSHVGISCSCLTTIVQLSCFSESSINNGNNSRVWLQLYVMYIKLETT